MMRRTESSIVLTVAETRLLVETTLLYAGIDFDNAVAMANVITMAEADGCRSHGLYRLEGCIEAVRSKRVAPKATPIVQPGTGAASRIDARGGFAPQSVVIGRHLLEQNAKSFGIAALAINNCYHFSALWADLESIARAGYVAFSFTLGRHCVALSGGRAPAFGANPMAFAFPRGTSQHPFVLDLSSSIVARGEIELHGRDGINIPPGWAIDREGNPTIDPTQALSGALLPFGGHKGAAIGIMVELLAGPLIGDLMSSEALKLDKGVGGPLRGGYLMLAINPQVFGNETTNIAIADNWLSALTRDHPSARLPGSRRYAARAHSQSHGIVIDRSLYEQILSLTSPASTL